MSWTPALTQLRDTLADLYSDEPSARRVVADAGLNPGRIDFSASAINNWQAILTEADRQDMVDAIVDVATRDFPRNKALASARAAYGGNAAPSQGAPSTPPSVSAPAARTAIKILFLGANPSDTTRLRLDEEVRGIDQALRLAQYRDRFDLIQQWAVRVGDLQGLLLRHQPHIVHFSGHGSEDGQILLEDNAGQAHPVSPRALSNTFAALNDNIRCIVLNACFSEIQAKALAENIDCVVGMSTEIGDEAAISFASAFYQALAYGRSVSTAFKLGCVQIDLESLDEQNTPQLLAQRADPAQVVFA